MSEDLLALFGDQAEVDNLMDPAFGLPLESPQAPPFPPPPPPLLAPPPPLTGIPGR